MLFERFLQTVNMAARMESTGSKNRIHVSKETAALLTSDGKGHWIRSRDEIVHAKGKGDIQV